ncbi:potassium/sodium hyperpolarization-activated cyclic nucleotide-gated channel 4 [Ptiloglossa arizonensis]|uniref:potassium/sodium hyperpolarization-activated cyclic nucleotide-gated channel 4 n=1 Tax=Ptiloglossa arizonensis TaxID=3350558 RepID=UPI003FA0F517
MELMAYVPYFSEAPNIERVPIIQHICEQPKEQDELDNFIKGNSIRSKIRRWFLRQCILFRKHPLTRWWLKSTSIVNYEISRHLALYPYMIHPFSSFRIVWESLMTIFTFVGLLVIPVSITFYFENYDNWYMINDTMNIVFLCDIVIWFFTGYYDYRTKVIVLNPRIVALKYLKNYFVIDFVSVIPIGFVNLIIPNSTWYCTTLNMMKILRIRNIIVYSRRLQNVYRMSFQLYKIVETFAITIVCVHWAGCLEYYVPMSVAYLGTLSNDSWIRSGYFRNKTTRTKRYLVCLNRATTALVSSVHYLDMKTPEDIILNLILTIVGFFGFLYLLSQFTYLLTTFDITIKYHLKIIQQLKEYMRYKELPRWLQRRLLTFYHYRNKKGFERNKKIIAEVSPCLREKLILHNYRALINSVELFKHLPETVVAQLVGTLRSEIFTIGDKVIEAGTRGDSLYFIVSGTLAVYNSTGTEVCHLEDGTYFGEIALVMENEYIIASVIAVQISEIYILDRNDFRRYVHRYPYLLNRLRNVALEHLNKSLNLEEAQHVNEAIASRYINISSVQGGAKSVRRAE